MYGKAVAPEYQGALTTLSVNSSLVDVLATGTEQLRAAERAGEPGEAAALTDEAGGRTAALAEAHRHIAAADAALTGVPLQARAVAELRALLDFLVRRDL
ncbi:hypothetical protein StrepF001_08970 [Streptomyces sp. F001]|nr:hypothetical protein StrepF001_08970 [Streptomyces sp. F001]